MGTISGINLLKAKTGLGPKLTGIERQLKTVSLIFLAAIVLVGGAAAIGHFVLSAQHKELVAGKRDVEAAIGVQKQKEGLYYAVKDRIGVVSEVIALYRPWTTIMDVVDRIAGSRSNTSFSIGEANTVNLVIQNEKLEESFGVVERVIWEVKKRAVANPVLQSVQYNEDGTVRLSISVTPIL